MELTGAEILVHSLQDEGVEYVFGYPGGAVLHIYDALYRQDKLTAYPGTPRAGRRPMRPTAMPVPPASRASCWSPPVPGATNAVTGIATAYMDSIPMVVLTGQVPTQLIGNDAFQEVDNVGITRPCVKHNFLVKDVRRSGGDDQKGLLYRHHGPSRSGGGRYAQGRHRAKGGISLSGDGQHALLQSGAMGHPGQIKKAVDLMLVRQAAHDLYRRRGDSEQCGGTLIELPACWDFPITNTLMGLGALPGHRPAVRRHAGHARHL